MAATLVAGSWVGPARADAPDTERREENRRKIEQMSEAERSRLMRSYGEFRKLPDDEKQRLRKLDLDLKSDDQLGQGELRTVMDTFVTWLSDLSHTEREEVCRQDNPAAREKLVRTLLDESTSRDFGRRRGLSPADLDAALGVLEQKMRDGNPRTAEQLGELKDLEGYRRHVKVLELAFPMPRGEGGQRVAQRGRNEPLWRPDAPDMAVIDRMSETLSESPQKRWLIRKSGEERARRLAGLVAAGLWAELKAAGPSQDTLHRFLIELEPSKRDRILNLPRDVSQWEQIRMYYEQYPDQSLPPPPFMAIGYLSGQPFPPGLGPWFNRGFNAGFFSRGGGQGARGERMRRDEGDATERLERAPNGRPRERRPRQAQPDAKEF
ncbi:MAG: hypothetical protein ACT4QC_21380 [Planctomycetaceae bacterium]